MKIFILIAIWGVFATSSGFRIPLDQEIQIIGGSVVDPHSILHFVSISFRDSGRHMCGGAIVSHNAIVTAAHCAELSGSASSFLITAGAHDLNHNGGTWQIRSGQIKKTHENYTEETFTNDIAIIWVSQPFEFNEYVQPIKIAPAGYDADLGIELNVAGFGSTSEGGDLSEKLHSVDVPVWTDENCRSAYSGFNQIADSMICAGLPEGGKDSCSGDSGGPLTQKLGSETLFVGIVSWGRGCAMPNSPGVNTEVSYFTNWITNNLNV